MMEVVGSESLNDDTFPISTGIVIVGGMKGLDGDRRSNG